MLSAYVEDSACIYKVGIQLFSLVDPRCFYTINMKIYVGTPPGPYCFSTKTTDLVKRMCEPVFGTSRNITMDNWFTSYEIVKRMLEQHKITIVGTIRKNKRDIPKELLDPSRP